MNTKIDDLMSKRVIQAQPHHSVGHVQDLMTKNKLSAVPVVDSDGVPVGIVSAIDLMSAKDSSPVNRVMTEEVVTIPQYNDVSQAARTMRRRKIHHLVVTHEKKVVGMISSFDLLRLVEKHRFEKKPAPTRSKKKKART